MPRIDYGRLDVPLIPVCQPGIVKQEAFEVFLSGRGLKLQV